MQTQLQIVSSSCTCQPNLHLTFLSQDLSHGNLFQSLTLKWLSPHRSLHVCTVIQHSLCISYCLCLSCQRVGCSSLEWCRIWAFSWRLIWAEECIVEGLLDGPRGACPTWTPRSAVWRVSRWTQRSLPHLNSCRWQFSLSPHHSFSCIHGPVWHVNLICPKPNMMYCLLTLDSLTCQRVWGVLCLYDPCQLHMQMSLSRSGTCWLTSLQSSKCSFSNFTRHWYSTWRQCDN